MKNYNLISKKTVYGIILLIMTIVTVIFLNSFYWPYEELSKRKILVGVIALLSIGLVPILSVQVNWCFENIQKMMQYISNCVRRVKENKKRILLFVVATLICICLSGTVTFVASRVLFQKTYNVRMFYMFFSLGIVALVIWFSRKNAAQKPEKIFLITALIMGIFCISVTPSRVGVSADDEIHYARTLEISNFLNGIMFKADEKNINDYVENFIEKIGLDRESDYAYETELNSSYEAREWSAHEFSEYNVWSISYVPAAVGIILARGLGLSYANVFNAGRVFNLLTYILLVYFAIRRIKHGKVLIAAIGLIPATIFMTTSYSYDPWVTGFTILGYSYFFAELQDEKPMENKNIAIMIGSITIGCIPKAIYFPLLFPLLFMPKKKFQSSKQRKIYYLSVIAMGLLLVVSFMLPIFINGMGTGDARGGTDVNSTEQVKYILNNPLTYAKTLFNFEFDYFIALANVSTTLQTFGYLGRGYFYGIVTIILIILTLLDREGREKESTLIKGATILGVVAALILSTTALYISFTPVGSDGVGGMQGRYLIPFLYPFLYAVGINGVTHKINKNTLTCVPMLIIAITFIWNIGRFCAIHY